MLMSTIPPSSTPANEPSTRWRSSPPRFGSLRQPVLARVYRYLFLVERDQDHRVGTLVAVHHRLGDPAALLEVVLDVGRRQVLAAGGDDDVLLAPGDREVAVLVDRAQVAGVQ